MKKLILCAAILAGAAIAHHSTAIDDLGKTTVINGTVRAFQWTNPHVWLWVDVPGSGTTWGVESGAPVQLARKGIKWNSFKPGDKISVTLHPLRSGKNGGLFVKAVLGDGAVVDAGDPAAAAAPPATP